MDWMRRLAARARRWLGGGAEAERGMDAEMRFHLEMESRALERAGHAPAEARRLARLRFGGVERYKEEGRDARGRLLEDVAQDVRYALRGMRRRPAFAGSVVLTLALGIGATTAVYSVVDGVLLRSLPYPGAERVVRIETWWEGEAAGAMSPAEYLDYRRGASGVFEHLGAYVPQAVTVSPAGGAERVDAAFVSAGVFPALGLEPLVGRTYGAEEELSGENPVVLSEGFWRRRFGADPGVIGRSVRVGGTAYTVTGVLPSAFRLPENMVAGTTPQLFLPLGLDPAVTYPRGSHFLQGVARLEPGVGVERAAEAVEGVVARFSADFPDDYEPAMNFRATVRPVREAVVREARLALMVALGAVVLVLLVGAANVGALLVARGEARRGEIALRSTLGARRPRLVRQLLVETLVLGLAGGALGVVLAWLAVTGLVALDPPGIPRLDEIGLSPRVLGFAAALSAASGLVFGLLPAFRVAPDRAGGILREETGRAAGGGRRLRQALVVGEIALALALLSGAGLLGRSLTSLLAVDTGLRIDGVLAAEFSVPSARYPDAESTRDFVERAIERLASLPEVEAAGAVTNLPLAESIGDVGVAIPGRALPDDDNLAVDWQAVTPGYDVAMGLRLLRGRWIRPSDRADALGAVVINRSFAETWWPGGDAVGSTIRLSADTGPGEARIVGVVEDVKHEGPGAPARLQVYIPHRQFHYWYGGGPARSLAVVARVRPGAAAGATAGIRRAFAELDPEIGLGAFMTLEQAYRDVLSRPRLVASLVGAFAATALVLAAIGVYGVTAHSVGRRRREFGIRMALGAGSRRIGRDVLLEALALAALGVGVGVAGSLVLSRSLRAVLFQVSPSDPLVLAGCAATLAAAALLAAWIPARRAIRTDPADTLRVE